MFVEIMEVALFVALVFLYFELRGRNKEKEDTSAVDELVAEGFSKTYCAQIINVISGCYNSLQNVGDGDKNEAEVAEKLIDYAYETMLELGEVYDIDCKYVRSIPKDTMKTILYNTYIKYRDIIACLKQGDTVVTDGSNYINLEVIRSDTTVEKLEDIRESEDAASDEEDKKFIEEDSKIETV